MKIYRFSEIEKVSIDASGTINIFISDEEILKISSTEIMTIATKITDSFLKNTFVPEQVTNQILLAIQDEQYISQETEQTFT